MKIALVGGAGFIGHNLAHRFKKIGHDVLIVDSLSVNNKWTVTGHPEYTAMIDERLELLHNAGVPLVYMDARNYHQMSRCLGAWKPDILVHLAAVAHIDRSNKDPLSTFDHSLVTLENSLDICRSIGIRQFVYFSSSTAYGDFKKPVVDETEICEPKGIYGSLKLAGELMVKAYGDTYSMPYTIIRPCALYGERCVSGRVTQKFVELAHAGKEIVIDGDGEGRHDFTYIEDLVNGIELVTRVDAAKGQIFNITAADARSLNDLVRIIREHYPHLVSRCGPADPEKPSRGTMSNDKAMALLGYEPRWNLERGMGYYIGWYKTFRERMK